jgi:ELWxxDGT repeat protein
MQEIRRALVHSLLAALCLGAAAGFPLQGQTTASLVADLAPGAEEIDRFIVYDLQPLRESALFTVFNPPSSDDQLWVSDGTVNGTRALEEICPGECGARRQVLGTLGGVALWAGQGEVRQHLWRSDGTREGTFMLGGGDLALAGLVDAIGSAYAFAGGSFYFTGHTEENGTEIWRTDGTQEGTRLVEDLAPGLDSSSIREIAAAGDEVFVLLENEIRIFGPDGSRRVHSFDGRSVDLWPIWKDRLFFRNGGTLWTSDGTPAGTRLLLESVGFESLRWMGSGTRGIYFVAVDPVHGQEVWRSDGTAQGTRRLTDLPDSIVLGALSDFRDATAAVEIGDTLLFVAYHIDVGPRLFRLSTKSGSVAPISQGRVERPLVPVGNRVVFTTSQNYRDCEVWSAGALGASVRIADDPSCVTSPLAGRVAFAAVRDRVYFATASPAGLQLWRSNGTAAGTDLLFARDADEYWEFAVSASGRRVFVSMDRGLWLWEASTGLRQLAGPGPRTRSSDPSELTALGNRLFFNICGSLWTSTGTAESTRLVAHFPGSRYCGDSLVPIAAGSSLFFLDPARQELWATDAAGSAPKLLARDLGAIQGLAAHQGAAWFVVRAGAHSEIWRSDGTPAGTRVAFALTGDTQIISPLFSAGGLLYFTARSGRTARSWKSGAAMERLPEPSRSSKPLVISGAISCVSDRSCTS